MIVTITGLIGSGKTSAAYMFSRLGANIILVDELGKKVLQKTAKDKVVKHFGEGILAADSTIDPQKLADIVFEKRKELLFLHKATHPGIKKLLKKKIKKNKINLIDAALYKEFDLHKISDKTILVKASKKNRYARYKNVYKRKNFNRREKFQKELKKADFVINNNSTKAQLKKQVGEIWLKLKK